MQLPRLDHVRILRQRPDEGLNEASRHTVIDTTDWPHIVSAMRKGGFYDQIMRGGPELDRVKQYLQAFTGEHGPANVDPTQCPTYPCFPGLNHRPFHDAETCPGVAVLEAAFPVIRDEALALGDSAQLDYTIASRPSRNWHDPRTWLRRRAPPKAWTVYPFYHMGVDVEAVTRRCPRTSAIVNSLPKVCLDYPWGDALVSVQGAQSRLPPHCSVDNLRLRCHLGIRIPGGTGLRVGGETREWREGRCLLFEDSFEHSVWNLSPERRIVLIVDFWHPDLTDVEVRALTAGFRKSEVRGIFMRKRIDMTDAPDAYVQHLEAALIEQDRAPELREFWPA